MKGETVTSWWAGAGDKIAPEGIYTGVIHTARWDRTLLELGFVIAMQEAHAIIRLRTPERQAAVFKAAGVVVQVPDHARRAPELEGKMLRATCTHKNFKETGLGGMVQTIRYAHWSDFEGVGE